MNRLEISKLVKYGLIFLIAGLIINYIYRMVFHSVSVEKLIMGSDMEGYYQYLTHFFIQDWSLFDRMSWTYPYGEGKTLSVFTCGMAIIWSPFFLMAHLISIFLGLDSNGYTNVYFGSIQFAGIIYTYVGLVFIYKFLREFFDHKNSLIATSIFFLATNLFYYSVLLGAGMSHAYSFSLIAVYLYFCTQFSKDPSPKNLLFLGVPFALAVLIRPTNIISGLFLLFYGVNNRVDLKSRFEFWLKNYWAIIALFVIGMIVFIPQMAYWHFVTGKFIVFSYQGSGFPYWLAPKFGIVLFGKYNGWLLYTPIVWFGLIGLLILLRRSQMNSAITLLILLIIIYVNASWCEPTFSAAVGQRAMIDFLPFLAIPMAFIISKIRGMSQPVRIVFGMIILLFIVYNIQFGFRYNSVLWWDSPWTWTKFWTTLKF